MRRLILLLLVFSAALPLRATTRYVTTTGSDSNPCTLASPCATPDHAFNAVAVAGDIVQVSAGVYSYGSGSMNLTNAGSSGGGYITLTCATRGACKITSSTGCPASCNTTVAAIQGNYTILDGFEITDTNAIGNNIGLYVTSSFVNITRNTIHHIEIDCGSAGGGGIQLTASTNNVTMDSNLIYDIGWPDGGSPKCPSSTVQTDGILPETNGAGIVITNNIVYHVSGGWGIGAGGFQGGANNPIIISNNTVFSNSNGGILIDYTGDFSTISNNIVLNNGVVRAQCGINTTVDSPPDTHILIANNNLFGNAGGNICSNGIQTGNINIDPSLNTTFVNWQANGFFAGGDYHEKLGSPTIVAGVSTGAPNHDFDGNLRPFGGGFDIGAYQDPAQIWFIRDDGGDMNRCTGHTNAPDPGSGTAQACALKHPMFLMAVSSAQAWRSDYLGGDIVQFALNASGQPGNYPIGQFNPATGRGINWTAYGINGGQCFNGTGIFDCHMPALPSGTSGAHTRWLGPCYPNCLNGAGNWTQGTAVLGAVNGAYNVLSVQGTQWFDVIGFDITQYTTCRTQGSGGGCSVGDDFGAHGIQLEDQQAQGPSNGTIQQVAIYGISAQGLKGSHLNQTSSDTMLFDHIFVFGNGMSGFDSDGGGCGTSCEDIGTVTLQNSSVDFNGCVAVLPIGAINSYGFPSTGVNYCYAQFTGGYGDGIVFIAANNVTFNISNVKARWNTQDAFDVLHLGDDQTHTQILNISNSLANGNMGQTYKVGGNTNSNVYNNVSISNCEEMSIGTAAEFAGFPSGWNSGLQSLNDYCRASGDQWALALSDGRTQNFIHNTSAGYGDTMYDIFCAGSCTTTDVLVFKDNISIGYVRPSTGLFPGGLLFNGVGDPFGNAGSNANYNSWYTLRFNTCPQDGTFETNFTCTNPVLANENIDTFDARMVNTSSPAYHTGITAGLTTDYAGTAFALPNPSRGAFELTGSAPTLVSMAVTPNPGAVNVSATFSMTCTATFSDSSTAPCTSPVWTDTATHSSVNSSTGVVTGVSAGADTISATISPISGNATVNVSALTVATPTASPAAGAYPPTVSVTLSDVTSGSAKCFTTDGTTPTAPVAGTCSGGTTQTYSTPISVATTTTIKAVGTKAGSLNSGVATFLYTITPPVPPQVVFSGTVSFSGQTTP